MNDDSAISFISVEKIEELKIGSLCRVNVSNNLLFLYASIEHYMSFTIDRFVQEELVFIVIDTVKEHMLKILTEDGSMFYMDYLIDEIEIGKKTNEL